MMMMMTTATVSTEVEEELLSVSNVSAAGAILIV